MDWDELRCLKLYEQTNFIKQAQLLAASCGIFSAKNFKLQVLLHFKVIVAIL